MKYIIFLLVFGIFIGCKNNNVDKKLVSKPSNNVSFPDTFKLTHDMIEVISMKPNDMPGSKFVVKTDFDTYKKGDILVITTKENKKGYPFYGPCGKKYCYWVNGKNGNVAVLSEHIAKDCRLLKQ